MFPPSLHKNILALDKQITLLECECDNIETEKRKRCISAKFASRVKDPGNYLKSSAAAVLKSDCDRPRLAGSGLCRKSQKIPVPNLQNQKEAPIKGPRDVAEAVDSARSGRRYYRKCPVCGSGYSGYSSVGECACGKDLLGHGLTEADTMSSEGEKKVLHKGILHAHPGGTIELTVTQKAVKHGTNPARAVAQKCLTSSKEPGPERSDSGSCVTRDNASSASSKVPVKKSSRTRKWSEILSHESDSLLDKRVAPGKFSDHGIRSSYSLGSKLISQLQLEARKSAAGPDPERLESDRGEHTRGEEFRNGNENRRIGSPASCPSRNQLRRSPVRKRVMENAVDASPTEIPEREVEEKEVQCVLRGDDRARSERSEETYDPAGTLCALIDSFKGKQSTEDTKRLVNEVEEALARINEEGCLTKEIPDGDGERLKEGNNVSRLRKLFWGTKKLCDKLMKEKEELAEDLAAKERIITSMSRNEMEYMTLISSLKANLEKKRMQVDESADIVKELEAIKDKLEAETKVADGLKKSHSRLQEEYHKCILENDKLKTQLRLNKLEAQKFHVLMAGKDAEIRRYREEVESFQKQITEQLMSLRSNNVANEVHKAMEAIIHNSVTFSQTEMDSELSDPRSAVKQRRRHRERLVHSSPTSSKSSQADSSWNHISSIRDDESNGMGDCNKAVIACDSEDEMLMVGGGRGGGYDAESSKHSLEGSVVNETRKDPSFVSCKSVGDDTLEAATQIEVKKSEDFVSNQKFRQNIEQLFHDIKMQCSQRIFPASDSFRLEDLLNSSETSELSEMSTSVVEIDEKLARS